MYKKLRSESERSRRPTTALARQAIEDWLLRGEREALRREISTYAIQVAGTASDLDKELEAAAIEHLVAKKAGEG